MLCTKCGAEMKEGLNFCPKCGAEVKDWDDAWGDGIKIKTSDAEGEKEKSVGYISENGSSSSGNSPVHFVHPMKWFKFLIYFALFFGAFYNAVMGLNYIMGTIYFSQTNGQVTADLVYGVYGSSLKTLDVLYGMVLLGTAVIGVIGRFKLAKYKIDGPKYVYILYTLALVSSVVYTIGVAMITGVQGTINASFIIGIIVQCFYLYANYKYFSKRSEMFVN